MSTWVFRLVSLLQISFHLLLNILPSCETREAGVNKGFRMPEAVIQASLDPVWGRELAGLAWDFLEIVAAKFWWYVPKSAPLHRLYNGASGEA